MKKRGSASVIGVVVLLAAASIIGWKWWSARPAPLPEGIALANGRIEAVQVDVAPKYPGRVESILVDEGDMVHTGQVLAVMDTTELQAMLAGAQAQLASAREAVAEARSAISIRASELKLAEQELARATPLAERGSVSQRELEQHQSARDAAEAALEMARARERTAEQGVQAAAASVSRIQAQIDECTLRATVDGRVLYRLAEEGEIKPAGGNVLTLLDLDDIYMEIFLPSAVATRLGIGSEARIVLDAVPEYVIPASVSFVSPEAQFTPKQVETQSERDKLMFRVKLKVPQDIVRPHMAKVKTGVRGVAYVRYDERTPWPPHLAPHLPESPSTEP